MRMSESIKNIATSLVAFQGEVKDPSKDGKANYGKYVQLDALLEVIRPALSKQGLSFLQFPGGDGQVITITTLLMHTSGEWIESDPFGLKAQKVDPQGAGSAVTYGRRYSLSSVLGLAWDEDDDGNKASNKDKATGKSLAEPQKATSPIDKPIEKQHDNKDEVIKQVAIKASQKKWSPKDVSKLIKDNFNLESSSDLTFDQARQLLKMIDEI